MKHILLIGTLITAAASQVSAQSIKVGCERGPWQAVIIDDATPAFIQSLEAYGYSRLEAQGIGDIICRDPELVGDAPGMVKAMQNILASSPPGR